MGSSNWTKTNVALPPNDDTVLIWFCGEYRLGWFHDMGNRQDSYWRFGSGEYKTDSVPFWMPLPTPPEGS